MSAALKNLLTFSVWVGPFSFKSVKRKFRKSVIVLNYVYIQCVIDRNGTIGKYNFDIKTFQRSKVFHIILPKKNEDLIISFAFVNTQVMSFEGGGVEVLQHSWTIFVGVLRINHSVLKS